MPATNTALDLELLGFDALANERHQSSAEALEPSSICWLILSASW